jgi:hypothetical protein
MAKLCPRGKAAAKRKFKVYPSAYANMYASAVCSGKVTPGGKKNRKKAMGGGMMNERIGLKHGSYKDKANPHIDQKVYVTKSGKEEASVVDKDSVIKNKKQRKMAGPQARKEVKHGGSMCKLATKGKGRAYGKNS